MMQLTMLRIAADHPIRWTDHMPHATWIRPESLLPVLSYLARVSGADEFGPDVLAGLKVALESTNEELGQWTSISLSGGHEIDLQLALDAESDTVLHVRSESSPAIQRKVAVALDLAGCFIMSDPSNGGPTR